MEVGQACSQEGRGSGWHLVSAVVAVVGHTCSWEGRGRGCCLVLGPLVVRVHTCSQGGRGSHWCLVSGPSRAAAVNACDCLWGQRWQWQLILAIGTPLDGALLPESMSLEKEAPVVVPPLSL